MTTTTRFQQSPLTQEVPEYVTTTTAQDVDCSEGSPWIWSAGKSAWCCELKGIGCFTQRPTTTTLTTATETTTLPGSTFTLLFDCDLDLEYAGSHWVEAK